MASGLPPGSVIVPASVDVNARLMVPALVVQNGVEQLAFSVPLYVAAELIVPVV